MNKTEVNDFEILLPNVNLETGTGTVHGLQPGLGRALTLTQNSGVSETSKPTFRVL